MLSLTLDLKDRSYPIYIGQNILTNIDCYQGITANTQVLIISNPNIAKLYLPQLQQTLDKIGCKVEVFLMPDGEEYKNLATFEQALTFLLTKNFNRDCYILALGGGVVGDLAGYVAASYQRGVAFIQIPTTLLAQVDSSVGGKTGLNHKLGKNMIGAFYQPKAVIIDINTLTSLPTRQLNAGLGEVIKYGLLADADFFNWLENNITELLKLSPQQLEYCIYHCCRLKAEVVTADETESNRRMLLNLGHTFGHAVETYTNYTKVLHGEAVAIGTMIAALLSYQLKHLSLTDIQRIEKLLIAANLPTESIANMQVSDYLNLMRKDKKVKAGKIRLVLLNSIGNAYVNAELTDDEIAAAIRQVCPTTQYLT